MVFVSVEKIAQNADVDAHNLWCHGRKYNVICCIDTTFATPVNHKPIDFGAGELSQCLDQVIRLR